MDLNQLERLARLRDSGALTDAEFLDQKRLLGTSKPIVTQAFPQSVSALGVSQRVLVLIGASVLIILVAFGFIYQSNGSTETGAAALSSSSGSSQTAGTATAEEREAYSRDLYDRPTGLSSESEARYEALPSEGQEYVDEQMARYDAACARSDAC